jgi:hypothetical protein
VGAWEGQLGARTLVLSVPACVRGTTWQDEAAGRNDAHWTALGTRLVALGLGGSLLRVGREFNGSWYPWKVTEGSQAAYIAGYQHVVGTLRAVPGAEFRFCWNPITGTGGLSAKGTESCYPGDAWVDEVGLDVYDFGAGSIYPGAAGMVTTSQQQQVLDAKLTAWDGIRGWYRLARDHGKPLSFPEWGLVLWKTGAAYLGGGDNAELINRMGWLIAGSTLGGWHALWEDPSQGGMGVSDPDKGRAASVPMARGAFLAAFGG